MGTERASSVTHQTLQDEETALTRGCTLSTRLQIKMKQMREVSIASVQCRVDGSL